MSALAESASQRTFHDLRAFAGDRKAGNAVAPDGDAFLSARRLLPIEKGAVTVAAIDLPAGSGEVTSLAADEFVIAAEGEVSFTDADGRTVDLAEGRSLVLAKGARFRWSTGSGASLLVVAYPNGGGSAAGIVPIDETAKLEASNPPLAALLVGETPSCRNHTDYRSGDGEFVCGTWDSTPYHRLPMVYRHYELMHLLAGSVTFVDEAGREGTFRKGDIFLVEAGASCSWDSREHVAKVYAIHRPA
ncbi:cupin domain-containing protein [Aureimonas sp. AU40]|uniref:cupin domain-containing protein n=1 Tax=Aureimonas sp. AU40 TaxID=1637747 RepID=UPI0009EB879C|nr:cupin domain-containing protein [Aureimonas sp. AU40]